MDENKIELLQYFAANAPENIPEWFHHVQPKMPSFSTPIEKECYRMFGLLSRNNLRGDQIPVYEKIEGIKVEWEIENKKARFFQWRIFFAKNLIEELEKKNT